MKSRQTILASILLLVLAAGALSQSASEIEQRYGAVKFYQVRPLTLMLPTFDANGQICRAEIYPNHQPQAQNLEEITYWPAPLPVSSDIGLLRAYRLNLTELRSIFDELAPASMRQGKGKASLEMQGFGGAYWTHLKFTNVVFGVDVGLRSGSPLLDMSAAENNMNNFLRPPFGEIIAASIRWTDRVCVERRDVEPGGADPGDVDLKAP